MNKKPMTCPPFPARQSLATLLMASPTFAHAAEVFEQGTVNGGPALLSAVIEAVDQFLEQRRSMSPVQRAALINVAAEFYQVQDRCPDGLPCTVATCKIVPCFRTLGPDALNAALTGRRNKSRRPRQ